MISSESKFSIPLETNSKNDHEWREITGGTSEIKGTLPIINAHDQLKPRVWGKPATSLAVTGWLLVRISKQ